VGEILLRAARRDELHELIAIDDAASVLYAQAGIRLVLDADHPFVVAEALRWADAIERNLAEVAVDHRDQPLGFIALGVVDGEPYIDQLAARPDVMRQGIGTALLNRAIARLGTDRMWLTTYDHVPWNRPWYERHGFVAVPDSGCGPELRAILELQRAALPLPEMRIAMARPGA
jgi:GNAT superfamily N-acetyltransferase